MIKLRNVITTYLKTIHPRVYYRRAPSTAEFPYLVFTCPLYPDGEGFEICVLTIDGWDKPTNGDTTELETLMELLKGKKDPVTNLPTGLDKKTFINDELVVTFFLDNILPVDDDDESIERRQHNYSGRLIRKG
ncbi:hypothetical protein [Desulfosporosinus sp.]|uniref:hypothetical protein n=1 Tax=Desulfosporosinus sp. TaxID=157907 RepID=UPI0025BA3D7C|nr:hypothetical protein [Desulfosporosinus sp.]MBC2721837.1 hypothetical protein [Desulfosporosinus sp.]MBC2726259.1 hypothetical protein [Desulfosporosinus sp.]